MDSAPFVYEQLPPQKDEIRLLELLPVTDHQRPNLRMIQHRLANVKQRYFAASYTWGTNKDSRTVLINGGEFCLRYNAFRFIEHLSRLNNVDSLVKDSGPVFFWIDSICINQQDTDEKAAQVAKMGQIFRDAYTVVVWLGAESESEVVVQLCNKYRKARPRETKLSKPDSISTSSWQDIVARVKARHERTVRSTAFPLIKALLDSQYWTRMWVVQELLLARSVWFLVGSNLVDFVELGVILTADYELFRSNIADLVLDIFLESRTGAELQGFLDMGFYSRSLPTMLSMCRNQSCYDPRDRIYGLRGVCIDLDHLQVDYGICPEVLFANIMKATLVEQHYQHRHDLIKEAGLIARVLGVTPSTVADASIQSSDVAAVLTTRDILMQLNLVAALNEHPLARKHSNDISSRLETSTTLSASSVNASSQSKTTNCVEQDTTRTHFSGQPHDPGASHGLLVNLECSEGLYVLRPVAGNIFTIDAAFDKLSDVGDLCLSAHELPLDSAVDLSRQFQPAVLPRQYLDSLQVMESWRDSWSVRVSPADLLILKGRHLSLDEHQPIITLANLITHVHAR